MLIPAAGSGVRLGAHLPKTLIDLAGRPMFVRAADSLVRHPLCIETVIAAPAGFEEYYLEAAGKAWADYDVRVVTGGRTRQESVTFALRSLQQDSDAILIHDAARPFITPDVIERVLAALMAGDTAALPGLPVTDTLKRVATDSRLVDSTVDRHDLMAVQTPQGLRRDAAQTAFDRATRDGLDGTDDVWLIEHYRLGSIRVVDGAPRNFKITTPEDLARARELLAYDTH
ncbi:MAG TPA: 2-C-methyl-D-erythritol 4-phosphate cytidylyltransferase [bacterium]